MGRLDIRIIGIDDTMARCSVADEETGLQVDFACAAGTPAHDAIRQMVRGAIETLARRRADRAMRLLADGVHTLRSPSL